MDKSKKIRNLEGKMNLFLMGFFLVGLFPSTGWTEEFAYVSFADLNSMIQSKAPAIVIVDTQPAQAYEKGHIKGAINIHYDVTSDPMQRQMMLIALPMDKMIVTYCDCTDDANSANVVQELYDLGYDLSSLRVLSGGSLRWVELKYPLEK